MVNKIIIMLICVTFSAGVSAQEEKFSWGVKAGLNLANYAGKDAKGSKMKVGYYVGAVTEFRLCEKFAVGPELVYSLQGASMDISGMDEKYKFNIHNINLPIMAKYYVLENLSINLGPQLGYAVIAKAKYEDTKENIEGYKKFDVSIGVGATYHFGNIFAEARYNYGLTKIVESAKMSNSVIQIGVGYKF